MNNIPFDTFWAGYPRRVAKGAARKAWDKAVRKTDAEAILAALGRQVAAGVFNVEPRYVPHPATWLNGERWDDEIAPPSAAGARGRNFLKGKGGGGYGF